MNIILIGAPGCGKGTISERLSEELKLPHISVGEFFRENMQKHTEIGKRVEKFMTSGQLVPDEITIECVKKRLQEIDCKNGFILDGFPRTFKQAKLFDGVCEINKLFEIVIPDSVSKERMMLRKRKDDTEEIIEKRFKDFWKEIIPIRDFYKNKIITINGNQTKDVVYKEVKNHILKGKENDCEISD